MGYQSTIAAEMIAGLTERQQQVLDLMLQHRTYKEIARELSISPHTVEQRVRAAKEKLGVHRRGDLATVYRELRATCGETLYGESPIDSEPPLLSKPWKPGKADDTVVNAASEVPTSLAPAIFEGPNGTLVRVGAIFAIAAAMLVIGVGGLSMLDQLSRLLS
jgi:DNA-binding CsgD family transcriptional regulator